MEGLALRGSIVHGHTEASLGRKILVSKDNATSCGGVGAGGSRQKGREEGVERGEERGEEGRGGYNELGQGCNELRSHTICSHTVN